MRRIIWPALAAVVLLIWTCGSVVAQDTGPTMQVTAGFDGYCRRDGWCPIYIHLSNEGAGVEGELNVAVRGASSGTEQDVYAKSVLLPAHSRKAFFLYLPAADWTSQLIVRLTSGGETLVLHPARVRRLGEEDRLYGVVSNNPSALNFLSDVAPAGWQAAVAHLDLETLLPSPLGWEALDVLILSDVDTTALGAEQRQALETWVLHGGHLIVGGGAGAARTVAGVADLLPVTVGGGTQSVENLWALGDQVAPGPYAVAEATLRDGEALIEQEGEQGSLILLARRNYGAGKVDFMAFDAGLNPFASWDDNTQMWEFIVGPRVADTRRLSVRNQYGVRDAINAIPGLKVPSTLQILAFMLVYTLLVGPVNYLILRKFERRELAWLTIPALVVGFTIIAYVTGFQIRGGMAIVHRLAAVYVPEGAGVGRVSQLVGLFSPRRTTYDVHVQDALVHQVPGDSYYGGPAAQPLYVAEEAGGSTVTGLRVDVGGIRPFVTEGYAVVPPVEADLRLAASTTGDLRVEGTLTMTGRLEEAVLLAGWQQQRLGDLEPGQVATVSVQVASGVVPPSYYHASQLPEQIVGPGNYLDDRNLHRRYQFLQAIFVPQGSGVTSGGMPLESGVYLIGWTEEQVPLPVEVVERPFSTFETGLYVYDLPVVGLETGTTVTIPPDLIERQVEEMTGPVEVWSERFHIGPESEVVFRFIVWPGVVVRQVDELVLDMQGSSYGTTTNPPTISLWNRESEEWDVLDVGWGRHSIPDAGAYVTSSGEVLLRLATGAEWSAEIESLTITITGQR